MRRIVRGLWIVLALLAAPALALGVDPPLSDPGQEARAIEIHKALRCLVCQNQSIHDSNAGLAVDLRRVVRERVQAGDNDEQVVGYVVARYGDWVLLKPPFNVKTALLWGAPAILILLGIVTVRSFHRRNRALAASTPAPLSTHERQRLERLIGEDAP